MIALFKEAPLAEKMIYWTREVGGDQRRRTSLRLTPGARSRLRPVQSFAPAGTLSPLSLLFNWPSRETESRRGRERCEEAEKKGRAEGPCRSPESSGRSPLLREEIARVSSRGGSVEH